MNGRIWIACGAVLAAAAVAAGAIGTHFLKQTLELPEAQLQTYEVAVRYQMVHALALILLGLVARRGNSRWLVGAGTAFVLGVALFSGGLFAWLSTGIKLFVHVVPVGGLAWIVGWLLLAVGALASVPRANGPRQQ
jgi:uncharacterized membrane protein YgdD (TMEM256/DUF423 family)